MDMRPKFALPPNVKLMINIGACLDIPTGTWLKGKKGEWILNGGLGYVTGMVGIGNNFKTTVLRYMMLSAWDKVEWCYPTSYAEYDTEVNAHEERSTSLAARFDNLKGRPLIEELRWQITDKSVYYADGWFDVWKTFIEEKRKIDGKKYLRSPFANRDRTDYLYAIPPTFGVVDSISEFYSKAESKMLDENDLGESGGNTFHMRAGLVKTRFLMEVPALAAGGYHYLGMTAQLGKTTAMPTGPMPSAPEKKLQYLTNGDKIKGATDKFTFATHNCWHAFRAAPLLTKDREAVYSRPEGDEEANTDLNLVSVRQLRSKSGPTGIVIELIVTQSEGVLESLTEFHFFKELDRFGLEGNNTWYNLSLYPDVKLSRTTIREKIDNDPKLRRAIKITSEMCQMKAFMPMEWDQIALTPAELYTKIKDKGYDWDEILQTRGWWAFNDDQHPLPYLSTKDLMMIAHDRYEGPYQKGWAKKQ